MDNIARFRAFMDAMRALPADLDPETWMDLVEVTDMKPREMMASCVALYGLKEATVVAEAIRTEMNMQGFWN